MSGPRYPLDDDRPLPDQLIDDVAAVFERHGLPRLDRIDRDELRQALERYVHGEQE